MKKLSDRMKEYEHTYRTKLTKRLPVIIRIDGKAFHTYTRGMQKPFDEVLSNAMWETSKFLAENVMGCKLVYTQSDEISLLITNYDKLTTESWFDNNIQKMVSIASSLATAKFNSIMCVAYPEKELAFFDARAFVLPKEEVNNYFLFRQQDAVKNSISMVAQANFKHSELQGLNGISMQDKLLLEKEVVYNNIETWKKRGICIVKKEFKKAESLRRKWIVDTEIPVFSEQPEYVTQHVYLEEK